MLKVPFVNFAAQFLEEKARLLETVEAVCAHGMYIGGPEVSKFEREVARYCGRQHAVALSSGTSALTLALVALGIDAGDEVITAPNSFVSSAAAIANVGATPVFADVCDDQNIDLSSVERAITPRTRAVMPVHLTGRLVQVEGIRDIAAKYGLQVVEDAAQAIGSSCNGTMAGGIGDIGCFSAHPLKNLNAIGDAGFVVLDDEDMAERIRSLANNGFSDRDTCLEWGTVARMDSIQAAVLSMRLERLDSVIERRRSNALQYRELLGSNDTFIPEIREGFIDTFHTFVIQVEKRDELRDYLASLGVGTAVHYPVPIHLQPAAARLGYRVGDFPTAERQAGRILSLPIHQFLSEKDVSIVADGVNRFFR